jgi:hypothetical protein
MKHKNKKPTKAELKAALDAEEMADNCETLVGMSLVVIEGWKALAADKISSGASCAWTHGLEIANAVDALDEAYANIMEILESQCDEHDAMDGKPAQAPPSHN